SAMKWSNLLFNFTLRICGMLVRLRLCRVYVECSETQALDQFINIVFTTRHKGERNNIAFLDYRQRRLPHGEFAALLAEISAHQLLRADCKHIRFIFNFEAALLLEFCNWTEIIRSLLYAAIIRERLRGNHHGRIDRLPWSPRWSLKNCHQCLWFCR